MIVLDRIAKCIEHVVVVLILSAIVFSMMMAMVNCIVPSSKQDQSARMESTLDMYRSFNLSPTTIRLHTDDLERRALAQYELQARGGR